MTYNTSIIKIRDSVRKRPGMYIGCTNRNGLDQLIYEIFDNAVDEALAGYCNKINITFHPEYNSVEITDNGRGIPVDIYPEEGISVATIIFTRTHPGINFETSDSGYKVSGGLQCVGATVTNSLSAYLELSIRKNGKVYYQRFEKGIPVNSLKIIRDMNLDEENGTTVRFSPDATMFPEALEEEGGINLSATYLKERIKRFSYLVKELQINLLDETGVKTEYYSENGIKDLINEQTEILIETIAKDNEDGEDYPSKLFDENIYFSAKDDISSVEVCFNYINNYFGSNILSFANNIHTTSGGTHVTGLQNVLKKVLEEYALKHKNIKNTFKTEDIFEGINVAISFLTQEPKFYGATKQRLSTVLSQKLIHASKEFLEIFLEKNPVLANLWIDRVMSAQKRREQFEKDKKVFIKQYGYFKD